MQVQIIDGTKFKIAVGHTCGDKFVFSTNTMSSDEATRRKQSERGVFKAPGDEKPKSYTPGKFSAKGIWDTTSSDEDYRLTLLRLRM